MSGDDVAVARQVHKFALLNGAPDHDGLSAMFVEVGSFARSSDPDHPVHGREAIRAFFHDRAKRSTRHVMTNIVVEALADNEVFAESYVTIFHADTLSVDSFNDRLLFDDGQWLFLERRGSIAFSYAVTPLPATPATVAPSRLALITTGRSGLQG